MTFAQLTQAALLGTERHSISAPAEATPLGDLLRKLDYTQREQALLSATALITAYERSGRQPARDTAPVTASCPEEQVPYAGTPAQTLLRRLLDGEQLQLLPEWLELALEAKALAAPELLPSVLITATSQSSLRQSILGVVGERGRWLAAQNPEWSWVGGSQTDESIWQTGTPAARALFLRQARQVNPDHALELLNSTWKQETPESRAAFISVLEVGINPNDEPFLESALDDKRKEVRRIAARLLARLPGSALVKRVTERAAPRLTFVAGKAGGILKLQLGKKPSIDVELPAECDKAMQRDGIEPKPPQGIGEKAWWLMQMLHVVPLDFWTKQWNTTPEEIIAASLLGEWKKELLEAWTQATVLQQNFTWAEPLFAFAIEQKQVEKFRGLLHAMPTAVREKQISGFLGKGDPTMTDVQASLLTECGDRWSIHLSHAVLDWMRKLTVTSSTDWMLRSKLKDFATSLHPATLSAAAQNWNTSQPHWEFWSKGMDEFLAVVQMRSDIHAAFSTQFSSSKP